MGFSIELANVESILENENLIVAFRIHSRPKNAGVKVHLQRMVVVLSALAAKNTSPKCSLTGKRPEMTE